MSTKYKLNWQSSTRRWRFMRDGTMHVRSVRQLKQEGYLESDCPETKEASYVGALKWQEAVMKPKGPTLTSSLWPESLGPKPLDEPAPPVPTKKTVGGAADLWIETAVKPRQKLGHIVHREVVNHRYGVRLFREWIGDSTPLKEVDETRWVAFFAYLAECVEAGKYKPTYCKHALRYCRDFLDWCTEMALHPGLRNLRSRKMSIGISTPKKDYFTKSEIHTLLENAKGQTKLHILLALNCGFTQQDISDLKHEEVDWKTDRIKRKRSKGRKHATVPEVDYPLWPETFQLLQQHRSKDPERVLVTHTGKPWVDKRGKDSDSVRTQYGYLQDATGITKSFRSFRKTAANTLGKRREYKALQQHFLGHAPTSVAHRHYVDQADQTLFDEAVAWLRGELIIGQ